MHILTKTFACTTVLLTTAVLSGCGNETVPDGWTQNYPSAPTDAQAAQNVKVSATVEVPQRATVGVAAPVLLRFHSDEKTVVAPRLLLSSATSTAGVALPTNSFEVFSAAGKAQTSGLADLLPNVGNRWSSASPPQPFMLPPIVVDGDVLVELKVAAKNAPTAGLYTAVAVDTGPGTDLSKTAIMYGVPTGPPTMLTIGAWTERMNRLPKTNQDEMPSAAPVGNFGTTTETWVPTPHGVTVDRTKPMGGVEKVKNMTVPAIDVAQVWWAGKKDVPGVSVANCTRTKCNFTLGWVTPENGDVGTLRIALSAGTYGAGGQMSCAGTVDSKPTTIVKAELTQQPWAGDVDSAMLKPPGEHSVKISCTITGTSEAPIIVWGQNVGGSEQYSDVALATRNGTLVSQILLPGQLTLQEMTEVEVDRNIPPRPGQKLPIN